jgi:FdhE protein
MTAPVAVLNGLKRQRPEWEPWLVVVGEILRDAASPHWDKVVPPLPASQVAGAPLVARVPLTVDTRALRDTFQRLVRVASRAGTPKMATLRGAAASDFDLAALFDASVWQEQQRVTEVASAIGADSEAFQAIVALLPVPFLQACSRTWAPSVREDWELGYCPVCGAWPAFAEVRGIERTRYLRCGRCGGEWHAHALSCPYCATTDHHDLVSLVPGNGASHAVIEACKRCGGYVKSFTKLQGCVPGAVMLEDLASVDLDVAALEQGYRRPNGAGYGREMSPS